MVPRSPQSDEDDARLARALVRLDALVNWERRDRDASMRQGLEPIADLCRRLGDPQTRWRCVHVAGTKGKGTTSALLAAGLARGGLRTGLYSSPHVVSIRERVQIDGEFVGKAPFADALERSLAARDVAVREGTAAAESTWFDVLTAAAFVCFAESGVEWAVVECGLGGRLDSTNVVQGDVCVVTNIDLEHTKILGATRALIAAEKVGILKRGSTLVTGVFPETGLAIDDDAARVLESRARELDCALIRPPREAPTMVGRNAALARLVLDELGRRGLRGSDGELVRAALLDDDLVAGLRLPARLERFQRHGTTIVLDAAHVASSVSQVLLELAADPSLPGRPFCVLALGKDKDAEGILKALAPAVDSLVCTTVASGPLVDAETLVREAAHVGIEAEKAVDPAQALARALRRAGSKRWVLVIGSFYLTGAVRAQLVSEPKP